MNKIEKIRQEIERLKDDYLNRSYTFVPTAMNQLLEFLDTLSEEPDKGLDVTDFCKPIDPGIAQCVADHWWEMLDSKEPDKSLEEAAEEYADGIIHLEDALMCKAAFIAGAEWQKEQMMNDAVEGEAEELYNDGESQCVVSVGTYFEPGDKVYVLKAEEE